MKAMILCAGLGTRLRPLTSRWPKPAIPLLGQPLLRFNLAVLRAAGVSHIGINTHHLPDAMRACAEAECARLNLPLSISYEPVIQGTAGGIRGLRHLLADDDFIVFNGDILFALELRTVIEAHQRSGAAGTMVLLPMPEQGEWAAVEADADLKVRRIAGHGPGGPGMNRWHFSGVHVLSPRIFDFMSPGGEEDINRSVYPRMIQSGLTIRGHVANDYWSDLGTPARYLGCQSDLLEGRVPLERFPGASPFEGATRDGSVWSRARASVGKVEAKAPLFVDSDAQVADGVKVDGPVYVGRAARIDQGARVDTCALLDGAHVHASESIKGGIAFGEQRTVAVPEGSSAGAH